MRRIIGEVGQDRDKARGGPRLAQALGERTVEMGNHGDHQVRLAGAPELLEQPHRLAVQQADEKLEHAHGLRGAERPAFLQHQVVEVLHAQAGQLAHPVDGVEQFLQVHQPDLPPALFFHNQAESLGSGAVAAARIKENKVGVDHALTFS